MTNQIDILSFYRQVFFNSKIEEYRFLFFFANSSVKVVKLRHNISLWSANNWVFGHIFFSFQANIWHFLGKNLDSHDTLHSKMASTIASFSCITFVAIFCSLSSLSTGQTIQSEGTVYFLYLYCSLFIHPF